MTYDERERYVVPIGEKGCEFDCSLHPKSGDVAEGCGVSRTGSARSAGNEDRGARVPLAVQENSYWGWGKGDPLDEFMRFVELYWGDIETEGFARLRENHGRFGSTMYGWEAKKRLRNIIQELADARAYLSSGDV